jgi:hypothetical protein
VKDVRDLAGLSEERTPLPEGFEIDPQVRYAAKVWPLRFAERVDALCGYGHCNQVVVPIRRDAESYEYTDEEREGLILAHLMQRHEWTRETIGEQ